MASFLWSEAPGDLLSDAAWVSVAQRGPQHRSGLAMKTQALTPSVQGFCSWLDGKLRARLDDLQHYLPSSHATGGERDDLSRPQVGLTTQGPNERRGPLKSMA